MRRKEAGRRFLFIFKKDDLVRDTHFDVFSKVASWPFCESRWIELFVSDAWKFKCEEICSLFVCRL